MRVGKIAELWVYPVKSMRGVRVATVALDAEGIRGDRRFAFESTNAPAGKPLLTGRERASMLLYSPTVGEDIYVQTPEGNHLPLSDSNLLLRGSETNDSIDEHRYELLHSPDRPLTDVRPVSFVSSGTLRAISSEMEQQIDPQRFRSNIVLELDAERPFEEESWSERVLCLGAEVSCAELLVRERIPRCRMVSLDPCTAEPNNTVLKHLAREHNGRLGMYATVRRPGTLQQGQSIFLL